MVPHACEWRYDSQTSDNFVSWHSFLTTVVREHPTTGGDLDNFVKFVCDALQKAVYNDDAQICEFCARKVYSAACGQGRTHVYISGI